MLKRLLSCVLLVAGVLLVLLGFTAALRLTIGGFVASIAAVAALLYAGASWFGAPPSPAADRSAPAASPLVVFDRENRVVCGPGAGDCVASLYPEALRLEIERRCTAALAGTGARFACAHNGLVTAFDAVPVRRADGTIVYGMLLTGESLPAAIAASA